MNKKQQVAFLNSQVACAMIELEAMKSANLERTMQNESLAYDEIDFFNLIKKYDLEYNDVCMLFKIK